MLEKRHVIHLTDSQVRKLTNIVEHSVQQMEEANNRPLKEQERLRAQDDLAEVHDVLIMLQAAAQGWD